MPKISILFKLLES